jgi:HSP20 family protein
MFEMMPWKNREGKVVPQFRNELDNLFNRFFDLDFPTLRERCSDVSWNPRIDVAEGNKDITVKAEIPGVDVKDINISLDGRRLTIKGEKKQESEEKEKHPC